MKKLYEVRDLRTRDYGTRLDGYYRHDKYVEHNGIRFFMHCCTENGDPCGFKSNKCLSVITPNGFAKLIDCYGVGYKYNNEYYQSVKEQDDYCDGLFKAFEDYIKKVYVK